MAEFEGFLVNNNQQPLQPAGCDQHVHARGFSDPPPPPAVQRGVLVQEPRHAWISLLHRLQSPTCYALVPFYDLRTDSLATRGTLDQLGPQQPPAAYWANLGHFLAHATTGHRATDQLGAQHPASGLGADLNPLGRS